jgi:hypothetical protein
MKFNDSSIPMGGVRIAGCRIGSFSQEGLSVGPRVPNIHVGDKGAAIVALGVEHPVDSHIVGAEPGTENGVGDDASAILTMYTKCGKTFQITRQQLFNNIVTILQQYQPRKTFHTDNNNV